MPLICQFFGIKIYMYWDEHFSTAKQLKLILAWCEIHKKELIQNWNSARENGEINKIEPLK
ncbi:MAG: DUF4160 domain-containing protein [Bdellovibrionaceae bacterium]|nr:DUF4160 domain-containing protein [Pseudobdellovibrionaceae bacterium]